jgi:hypothetical protein
MPEYFCQCCNFKTVDKTKYKCHIESAKHMKQSNIPTAVRCETPPPKSDEIAELRAMVLEMSKTILVLNQKIDTLTSKLESQPVPEPIKIEQPIKIENPQPIRIECRSDEIKSKYMSVDEEKKYISDTCARLKDDALEWLTDYEPRQKKPKFHDPKSAYNLIDAFKYNLISTLL